MMSPARAGSTLKLPPTPIKLMNKVNQFEQYRPYLFSVAYRMLGSVMEAEDMVQETYLRYEATDIAHVRSLKSFLCTITTRLCLDQLKSAKNRRESYIGPWLPEPLITENLPLKAVAQKEQLTMAFLILLENLTPVERAVYLLREVFEYDYAEISEMVGKAESNCRQLFSRAKKHIVARRPRFDSSLEAQRRVLDSFMVAVQEGDVAKLGMVLAEDARCWSDGGVVTAARKPLFGRENVARFVLGIHRLAPPNVTYQFVEINGTLSMIASIAGQLITVMNFLIFEGEIVEIRSVLNPEKLTHIQT